MIYGKNPTLLNVTYIKPDKKREQKECFQVIYADDRGEVHYTEEKAEADIYIVKPEFRTYTYNKPEERVEHMDKRRVLISRIRYEIAKEAGEWGKSIIEKSYQLRDQRILNQLYKWPYAYACDFQPEYYYMKNWYEKYPLGTPKLTKAFLDIEVDQLDFSIDLDNVKESAYAPVNCVTVMIENTKEVFTFCLKPYEPPKGGRTNAEFHDRYALYKKQITAHKEVFENPQNFIQMCHDAFDATYGVLNYHLREYTEEIELIADVFRLINNRKPNFIMIWNMRFDIPYLLGRIEVLGYDPSSIVCSPEIPNPNCYFKIDKSTFMIEKQYDFFYCTAFTQYICQMRLYSSIRKSQHTLKSVKLNSIADRELRDRKVDYSEEGNITLFAYNNWPRYILYNIKDVLLQFGIERKTNDLMTYYIRSHSNLTPYNKIFRETHLLRNVREMYFEKDGWVQGNNVNNISEGVTDQTAAKFYKQPEDESADESGDASFKGAINADPKWNARVGQKILGIPSTNIHRNTVDFDMGAFYPSSKIASNMDPITLLFKASLINDEFESGEFRNRSLNQVYRERDKNGNERSIDITGEAVNTYVGGNILTFGYNYLNMPNVREMYEIIMNELRKES